jgi:hypothetical protein
MTHTGACGFKTVLASSSRYGLERPVRRLAPLASAKRRDYWKWAATSPCRARLRGGCKPAQLSRLAWLRPPIRSVLAPPRPPAPAQRIGSLTLPAAPGSHPLSAPDHCDRLPLSGEPDRPPSALWLANGRHVRAGNGQKNQCFLSRTAKRVDSRAGSGRAFCIADPVHDRLAFADGHFLGVVIERKSALL